ncbi:hypothetical protein B0H66DRAFT_619658 [Apodospora peruviana]|uniref:Uncharacterized protein n=1 Tax=Apodospora peruviana TaxID=516989 RepID=A0AAE0M875_9PEZI|nr:hypothetical protein B0H66DRAFT_619658 [Apodospora peruviana]
MTIQESWRRIRGGGSQTSKYKFESESVFSKTTRNTSDSTATSFPSAHQSRTYHQRQPSNQSNNNCSRPFGKFARALLMCRSDKDASIEGQRPPPDDEKISSDSLSRCNTGGFHPLCREMELHPAPPKPNSMIKKMKARKTPKARPLPTREEKCKHDEDDDCPHRRHQKLLNSYTIKFGRQQQQQQQQKKKKKRQKSSTGTGRRKSSAGVASYYSNVSPHGSTPGSLDVMTKVRWVAGLKG